MTKYDSPTALGHPLGSSRTAQDGLEEASEGVDSPCTHERLVDEGFDRFLCLDCAEVLERKRLTNL